LTQRAREQPLQPRAHGGHLGIEPRVVVAIECDHALGPRVRAHDRARIRGRDESVGEADEEQSRHVARTAGIRAAVHGGR